MVLRYDRRDFLSENRCTKFKNQQKRRSPVEAPVLNSDFILTYRIACEVLLPILDNPTQLAIAIYEEMHTNLIKNLYIAAPPNEKDFVRKLTKILSSKGVQVVNSDQAQLFMKGHYPNCDHFKVESVLPKSETWYFKYSGSFFGLDIIVRARNLFKIKLFYSIPQINLVFKYFQFSTGRISLQLFMCMTHTVWLKIIRIVNGILTKWNNRYKTVSVFDLMKWI